MRRIFFLSLIAVLFAHVTTPAIAQELKPTVSKMELNDGDTVVFLGDSITHQCLYTQYIEDFFYTRFPDKHIKFHNAGVSGDRANDALTRFDRDVASFKPKYVTILLGMNDASYRHFDHDIFTRYEGDMITLLDRIKDIKATAIPMTPTMFDSRAVLIGKRKGNEARDKYYNAVLAFYGSWLREQAGVRGLGFVDMYGPLNLITMNQRKTDPNFTLIRDAVHPGASGQVVMAYSILDDMGLRGSVSSIHIQRRGKKWVGIAGKDKVTDLEVTDDKVSFTFQAAALPWVLPPEAKLGFDLTKSGHKTGAERFRVSGLQAGQYELRIDGELIGKFAHLALGSKVKLQNFTNTPQSQQALKVAMLNKERNEKAVRPMRNLWSRMKGKRRQAEAKPDEFAAFKKQFDEQLSTLLKSIDDYDARIRQINKPLPRKYELTRSSK